MAIKFTEATWYSRVATLIFFLGMLPILTFYIGRQFQKTVETLTDPYLVVCTE